jgi:hypothetical protein
MQEPPKVIRMLEGDASPDRDLEYLLEGVNDPNKREFLADFYHRHCGGDPQAFPIQFMECMKVYSGAVLRNTGRLNRAASAFLEQFDAVLEAYEARVKAHADAVTDGCSQSEAHIQRLEDDIRAWRESEASARAIAVEQIQERNNQLRDSIREVLGIASKSYELSSRAKYDTLINRAFIAILCALQVLLILAVMFFFMFKP